MLETLPRITIKRTLRVYLTVFLKNTLSLKSVFDKK